jgi:beta-glucosidase-like glycosyl hydrolase
VYGPHALDTSASRALALRASKESIVLLRNDASLLPLLPPPGGGGGGGSGGDRGGRLHGAASTVAMHETGGKTGVGPASNNAKAGLVAETMTVGVLGPTANDTEVIVGGKQDYCPAFRVTPLAGIRARAALTLTRAVRTAEVGGGTAPARVEVLAGGWLRPEEAAGGRWHWQHWHSRNPNQAHPCPPAPPSGGIAANVSALHAQ